MSDFLDLQGAKDLNADAIHIGAVANSKDPATGLPILTHVNRAGGTNRTFAGLEAEFEAQIAAHEAEFIAQLQAQGWNPVTGSFEAGGTIVNRRDIMWWEAAKSWYSWQGVIPVDGYVVPAGSTPATAGGVSHTAWVDRTDAALRSEVYTPKKTPKISIMQRYTSEYVRSLADQVENPHIDLASGTSLSHVEIIFPCTDFTAITIEVKMDVLGGTVGTDITFVATACASLLRDSTSSKTTSYTYLGDGVYSVTLSGTPKEYLAFSVRALASTSAHVKVKSIKVRDVATSKITYRTIIDELVSSSEWKNSSDILCDITFGTTMRQVVQLSGNSFIHSSGVVNLSPVGSSDYFSSPYSLDFYLDYLAGLGSKIGKTLSLAGGDYSPYRRLISLPIIKDLNIIAKNGQARILAGKEMKTSNWTLVQSAPYYVYSCSYDYDTNPDSSIRAGTKQPYVSCVIQRFNKGKSQLHYKFTAVGSLAEVKASSRSVWYDYANKTLYFSFDDLNDACYVYVCEADKGIAFASSSSPYAVNSFNVEVIAPKVTPWYFSANSYVNGLRYNKHISLHYCSAIGGYSNAGFAFSNIDNEQIDCYSASNGGDGFNYHNAGKCYTKGGISKGNGDDGISHHEACVGYVEGLYIQDNAAAYSVPAFGAVVHHINCIGVAPTSGLSPKSYAASFASLAGQDSNANATYESCKTFGGTHDYSAVSNQTGYTANLRVNNPTVADDKDSISILESGSVVVEYKP